jgi:hypothetical protein
MDDWNWNSKPWRQYAEVGILGLIVIAVAIAYAVSRVLSPN